MHNKLLIVITSVGVGRYEKEEVGSFISIFTIIYCLNIFFTNSINSFKKIDNTVEAPDNFLHVAQISCDFLTFNLSKPYEHVWSFI